MNKIYKVIWSKVKHQYVVVSELAHSNGKQSRTSRNSIRSRIAALVVCGAITAFGVYGTLPANSVFAAAAETVAGQYIAVAVDANNQGRYSIGDTRTFEDAQGKTHNYTWVNVDGKNYWVREGYTITIENGSRFTAYDKWGNPIAPDNTYIIDSQKSDSADSEGLISSSQVVIGDDSAHTTLTGNKLNSIDAGIYGGAVNTGGTQVPSSFNYYINDNGNGWKDVGEETSVSSMDNFKKVYKMADGTYNTDRRGKGTTVSTDNLYVIDGELGAFFNSNGSVYTGNVYGHNNEVLMTGVENGTYYSYWGTEINDPNTSLSEMTVGDLKKIVGGINDTIYTAQGDDIKQVSVQKSGDNGGTIGLIRRGDWNGTAYEKTDPVPGTITVTSTGGEGKDVAIQFSNDKGSFTVDAGSKVVANNGAGGTDLETISVNGQTFNVIGGAISGQIDSEGNVKIQQGNKVPVTIGKVSDWNVKSGQINGSTLTLTTENAYDGNPKTGTVTIEGVASTNYVDAKDALNVKYDSAEKTSVTLGGKTGTPVKLTNVANGTTTYDAVNFSQLEAVQNAENYVTSGSINNENGTITLNRVQGGDVTIEGLSQYVANKDEYATSAELNGSELTINRHLGEAIKVDLSQLTSGLSGTDYQVVANPVEGSDGVYSVSEDGTLKLTVKDLNNPNAEAKEVSINGIAQKDYVDAKDALNVKYDSAEKTSVTLGGKTGTPVKLTNVANGTTTYDAVNFSQLEAVQNAENYVTSGSINNENGTITLNRVQGGDVTIEGLSQYVANKDEYATSAELNGSELTINRHLGEAIKVDLSQLTSGLSGTDYQVVANPVEGSDGVYSVSEDGTLKLTVKDLNNPNAEAKEVSINGIAQKDYVDAKDALNVKYDSADKTSVTLGNSGTPVKLTNVANGTIEKDSKDAVNAGQLYDVNQKVDAGWTATDGTTNIAVNPTETGTTTLKFAGDNNIAVTADAENNAINVELNPDVNLKGEGKNSDNRVWLSGSNGTITVTTENNLSEKTTVINGGNVYVGSSVSVGDKVEITDKDITGLSNTSWNGTTDDESRAATEGQLKDISTTVNAGWTATDSNGNSIVVNPENKSTLNFAGDNNIAVTADAENNAINVELNPDVNLKGEGKNSDNRVWLSGSNGTITVTTENNLSEKTTVINGGNVYVGSSVSVGDKVEITDKDITGLSNTSWNGTTDDESRAATEGQLKDISTTVNAGWTATDSNGASIVVNPENGSTLNFAGDRNIEVKANEKDGSIDVSLKDDMVLGGKEGTSRVEIGGTNGTIMATKDPNSMAATTTIDGGNVYVGSSISVGDKVEITDKDITGLSNTSWNGTTDDESRAATEGQLKDISTTVNAGWTATDSNGASIVVNPENGSTLNFAGDRNIEVKANEKDGSIDVSLKDDMVLGGKEGTSRVEIGGTNGTIMATKDPNSMAATTTIDGGNVYVGSSISVGDKVEITDKDITGLSNTEWNGTTTTPDRAATEGQLQQVSNDVNAGWIATDNNGSQVNITPDNNKLNFAGDENITVTAANNEIKTTLNDDIVLGDYLNGDDGVLIGGSSGTISATNSITVGEDQGLIIDGQKKEIQGLSNTTWNEKIANDAAVEGSTAASTAATQGQLQEVSKVANAGWTASDGTNSISVKPNETLNFVGDENLTVSADGTDKELKVSLNDDITLGDGENAIKIDGTNGTLNIGSTFAVAEDGTVLSDGDVIADADGEKYSLSEVGKYAVRYDKTNDGTSTITLVDGDDLSGTRIKNVADGVDPKDAVNVSQLEAVEATANAGWTASDGTNSISIKPNETLNFVGDENLTVSADGTDKKLKVSLNDDITLGNPKAGNTEGERSFTINTTDPEGYVPDSYKEGNSSGAEFIKENGGFMLFATDTQGFGVFGVTAKGSAWARDFKTYTTDIYGNNTQYSLNEIGDAVAQMSSYYNGKDSYTVFSRYLNEAEKDNPFVTVDEDGNTINATRDIPLALRDDGAVLIGATIKGEDFTDNGIRINAETKTTYDKNGNEVTNNIATITGLENTEWKPPTPVATLAANDGSATVTSRAATESQLNDLYSAVAAYDVNVDGTIDYSHIALAGTPYGASRSGNGTHTGGTSITNVAYASGKDGSEAVNVDYLNDAISDAAENGSISTSDQHLVANTETGSNGVYKPNDDGNVNLIVSDEKGNSSTIIIGDVASKEDLDNLKDDVGDLDYSKVEGDTIIDGDSVTDAIGKLDNKIDNITGTATDADNNTVTGGKINSDGTISLTQKDKDSIKLEGQLTDSGVVQEGTSFDKETGTITITSQDKYSGETSSVKVEGIASTEVVGATNKEDLATAYKDADKDGNATTEYITDSESMVEADVALDHAIQDVAGTSYANDMVLSNRIDSVEKRLGNVEERIDKVGAMAAAIANLRTMGFDPEAPTEIAIGVGQYKSETGIAIGVFHYPNQDFMLSASLSSSGDELMGGIGATWKLGRKSAAERAKDEEARHLEQAEEMKKLAQQEKVKAQAQRHAKLLAERQQASQKNA